VVETAYLIDCLEGVGEKVEILCLGEIVGGVVSCKGKDLMDSDDHR
jgi:hypothetical protein